MRIVALLRRFIEYSAAILHLTAWQKRGGYNEIDSPPCKGLIAVRLRRADFPSWEFGWSQSSMQWCNMFLRTVQCQVHRAPSNTAQPILDTTP